MQAMETSPTCLKKRPWTREEDRRLRDLVHQYGPKKWSLIAFLFGGRTGRQCRERWSNHLSPEVNKAPYTQREDSLILELVQQHGHRWSLIARQLPGRTDHSIKNHFNTTLRRDYFALTLAQQRQQQQQQQAQNSNKDPTHASPDSPNSAESEGTIQLHATTVSPPPRHLRLHPVFGLTHTHDHDPTTGLAPIVVAVARCWRAAQRNTRDN